MVPVFVAVSALLVVGVVSQYTDCTYGYFDIDNSTDECAFNCEYDDRFLAISDLSFAFIRDRCYNVDLAATKYPSSCSSLSDLVWPQAGTYCSCPYCKCSTLALQGEAQTYTRYFGQICANCTCQTYSYLFGEQLVRRCDFVSSDSDWYSWNDFKCPPATCTDDDGSVYTSGDRWFKGTDTCSMCYCTGSGTAQCVTGYSNIVDSSIDAIAYGFRDECESETRACLSEPSQMVAYGGCSDCPRCSCGTHAVGDEWYVESQDESDEASNSYTCLKCTCATDSYGNYASCDDNNYYLDGYGSCPPYHAETTLQCHSGSEYDVVGASSVAVASTLNPTDCSDWSTPLYCGWTVSEGEDDIDADWGCGDSVLCEEFIGSDSCMKYTFDGTYTDCDGVSQTYGQTTYQYCCSSADCNYQDIDTSSCTTNTAFQAVTQQLWECIYSENGWYDRQCQNEYVDEITCSGVKELLSSQIRCLCTAYGSLYGLLTSSAHKAWLQDQIDALMKQDDQWKDVFGCDYEFQCDLEEGGVFTDGALNPLWLLGIMWSAVVAVAV